MHDGIELDFVSGIGVSSTTNTRGTVHENGFRLCATSTPLRQEDIVNNLKARQLLPATTTRSEAVAEEAKQISGNKLHTKRNTATQNTCVGVAKAVEHLDRRLIVLLCLFAVLIIGYKMVIVAMPYLNSSNTNVLSEYAQAKLNEALIWSNERDWLAILTPLICGLAMAVFSYTLVYLDSKVPGLDPPSPFSPKSKYSYRQQRNSSLHLGYMMAISAGFIVTILMYANFDA